jgi:hypothetical protein
MENIERKIVQGVKQRMNIHLDKVISDSVDKRYADLIDAIYYKKVDFSFQGCEAEEFFGKLKQSDQKRANIQTEMMKDF